MDAIKELCELLREAGVRPLFGLRQQGHMPTVERMLKDGATWAEIGKAIGWAGKAVKESHWMETTLEAGAAAELERIRRLVYQMTTGADVEPLCDACDRAGIKKHSIPAQLELGWNMALREFLLRLEEPAQTTTMPASLAASRAIATAASIGTRGPGRPTASHGDAPLRPHPLSGRGPADSGGTAMSDVLVTVPKDLWEDWIAEGDLPGDRWRGDYWSYYLSGGVPDLQFTGQVWCAEASRPSVSDRGPGGNAPLQELVWGHLAGADRSWKLTSPDQRCYVVAHSRLRGYADLFAIEINHHGSLKALIRRGGAVAVTIAEPIRGFRGWRYRWWDRAAEQPFADWKRP